MWETIKNDPVLRTVTVLVLGLFGFWFLFNTLFGPNPAWTSGGHEGGYYMGYQSLMSSFNGTLALLLTLIIKLLFVALVVAVIAAIALALKQYWPELRSSFGTTAPKAVTGSVASLTCVECGTISVNDYSYCPQCGKALKEKCSSCGTSVQAGWKCCPGCGKEITV